MRLSIALPFKKIVTVLCARRFPGPMARLNFNRWGLSDGLISRSSPRFRNQRLSSAAVVDPSKRFPASRGYKILKFRVAADD